MGKQDPDIRKQQIIDAATAVFVRKGFHQASMDDIVQESGLSKGGLYWHFKSKDDIITAVLDQFFQAEMAHILEILAAPLPADEKIRQFTSQMIRDTKAQLEQYLNIWIEFYALAARGAPMHDKLLEYMHQMTELMATLFQQGIDEGVFAPLDVQATAVILTAQFEGLILLWAIKPDEIEIVSLTETAVDLLLKSISANQPVS